MRQPSTIIILSRFLDSPYAPIKADSFQDYIKEGFHKEDHERLAVLFKDLDKRGCFVMLTNHDTRLIRELYRDYKIDVVSVRRAINSDASKRRGTEVIVTNYLGALAGKASECHAFLLDICRKTGRNN